MSSEDTDPGSQAAIAQPTTDEPARQRVETLEEVIPERLGKVLARSLTGLPPDPTFWAIEGVPAINEVRPGMKLYTDRSERLLDALVFRPDGSFLLLYRFRGGEDEAPSGPFEQKSAVVPPAAAYALQDWFQATGIAQAYKQALVDDESLTVARQEALQADGVDPETIALERGATLIKAGLDEPSIGRLRQPVITQALLAAQLDDATIETRRAAAYDEAGLDNEFLKRRMQRVLEKNNLDERSVRNRRAEALRKAGLA